MLYNQHVRVIYAFLFWGCFRAEVVLKEERMNLVAQTQVFARIKDRMGTGEWLRGQTEHCMLAVRGKPIFLQGNHTTVLEAMRREHSRKPEEFYALVEETSPGNKVELFARQKRVGWQHFGDQPQLFSR